MRISFKELCGVLKPERWMTGDRVGRREDPPPTGAALGVSIDSRSKDLKNKVFFALRGDRFDGHDFVVEALNQGALVGVVKVGFLTPPLQAALPPRALCMEVKDPLKSLSELAVFWRGRQKGLKVMGITGSVGKTTTKHLCFQMMRGDFKVAASSKSFNNFYGVPLSLLSTPRGTEFLIQEMGMNQKGEIRGLCRIASPDIVAVTTVGQAHIGPLAGQDQIAGEKEQIYLSAPPGAKAVFNLDNPYTREMYHRYRLKRKKEGGGEVLTFSCRREERADVFLQIVKKGVQSFVVEGHLQGVKGKGEVPLAGSHQLTNLGAACTLALSAGMSPHRVWDSLPSLSGPPGRFQWVRLKSGARALFDAYNGSPESVTALLDYFLSPLVKGKKILILGDLLELGSYLPGLQKQWSKTLSQNPLDTLWLIGKQSHALGRLLKTKNFKGTLHISENKSPEVCRQILKELKPSCVLALKASRKMQLETVLHSLQPLDREQGNNALQKKLCLGFYGD